MQGAAVGYNDFDINFFGTHINFARFRHTVPLTVTALSRGLATGIRCSNASC